MLIKTAIWYFIICLTFLSESYVFALQLDIWDNLKNLHLEFADRDNRSIARIEQQKEVAVRLIEQASGSSDRALLNKAFNEIFASSYALFDIYDQYCISSRRNLPAILPPELSKPVEYERRARENLDKSEVLKNEASKAEDLYKAERLYLMAHDLELIALLYKGRALRIYQDFPVIYAYQWDDDFTIMREETERIVRVIYETDENEEDTIISKENDFSELDTDSTKGIIFIVQIAAHVEQIEQPALNTIYKGEREVKMLYEDGWYKYYLGPFRNFAEADAINKSLNITNAFIAAYSDNQRIGVNQARILQEQQ